MLVNWIYSVFWVFLFHFMYDVCKNRNLMNIFGNFFWGTFLDYIQKYRKLFTYYTTCICVDYQKINRYISLKSQFDEHIWEFIGGTFLDYIQKYGKLFTYYTTCICVYYQKINRYISLRIKYRCSRRNVPARYDTKMCN